MATNRLDGSLNLTGKLYIADTVVNQTGAPILNASDGDHSRTVGFFQAGSATSATIPLGEMIGAGTIKRASVYLITACTSDATVTVDIKKNGTTILSSVMTLNSTHSAREVVAGTLSVTTFADGDVFEAVIVATAGGGAVGTGLWGGIFVDEEYASD